jgi:hypothetical protein
MVKRIQCRRGTMGGADPKGVITHPRPASKITDFFFSYCVLRWWWWWCKVLITRYVHTHECNAKCDFYIKKKCDLLAYYIHAQEWFLHTNCNFYPKSVMFTYTSVILTRDRVNMTLTTVIYTRRVQFQTQSKISIRRV